MRTSELEVLVVVTLWSVIGLVSGGSVTYVGGEPVDLYPRYNFGYSVQDSITGDFKQHQESRDGDVVVGEYSLIESDGSLRRVRYTADSVNGFNAVVERQVGYAAPTAPVQVVKAHSYAVPALPIAPAVSPVHVLPPLGSHTRPVISVRPPRPVQVIHQRPVQVIQPRPPIIQHPVIIQDHPRPVVVQPPSFPPSQIVPVVHPQPQPPSPPQPAPILPVVQPQPQPQPQPLPPPQAEPQPLPPPQAEPQPLPPPQQQPQPDPVYPDDIFDNTEAIEIPSADFIEEQVPQQQPTPTPAPPPPQAPAQLPALPQPRPPQQATQPISRPPPVQQQQPQQEQINFDDVEDAIVIPADEGARARSSGFGNNGRSPFSFNSGRGNQFNSRLAL